MGEDGKGDSVGPGVGSKPSCGVGVTGEGSMGGVGLGGGEGERKRNLTITTLPIIRINKANTLSLQERLIIKPFALSGRELSCEVSIFMERERGIEPPSPAWKAGALPLCYSRFSSF